MDTNRNSFGKFETAHESGANAVRSVEIFGLSATYQCSNKMKMRLQNSPEKEEPPSERNGVNKSGLGATIGVGTVCDDGLGFPSSRFEINVSRVREIRRVKQREKSV